MGNNLNHVAVRSLQGAAYGWGIGCLICADGIHTETMGKDFTATIDTNMYKAQITYNPSLYTSLPREGTSSKVLYLPLAIPGICAGVGALAGMVYGIYERTLGAGQGPKEDKRVHQH